VKRCTKDTAEPECLSEFRDRNPDADWDGDFRSEGRTCYGALRQTLRRAQGGLCCYCGIRLVPNDEQIAHFHPKSTSTSGRNWALDWDNLWLEPNINTYSGNRHEPTRD
jgi:uncharacterized protein (TIGR02646 family)